MARRKSAIAGSVGDSTEQVRAGSVRAHRSTYPQCRFRQRRSPLPVLRWAGGVDRSRGSEIPWWSACLGERRGSVPPMQSAQRITLSRRHRIPAQQTPLGTPPVWVGICQSGPTNGPALELVFARRVGLDRPDVLGWPPKGVPQALVRRPLPGNRFR